MDACPDHRPETYGVSPIKAGWLEGELGDVPADQMRGKALVDMDTEEPSSEFRSLISQISELESSGLKFRRAGDEAGAIGMFEAALALASSASKHPGRARVRLQILEIATRLALHSGETERAERTAAEAMAIDMTAVCAGEWVCFRDPTLWPDEWLVAAIRREPPNMDALNTLVKRHWPELFSRCLMLTLYQANANDLAQDVWRRVLKGRERLSPGRNFIGYLVTIATNLWRDSLRSARRAGPLAPSRITSLDAAMIFNEQEEITLAEMLPDLTNSVLAERRIMAEEIDEALRSLAPPIREVLVARYLDGESCAEIGKRHGRTEQTIRNWLRSAISEIKKRLGQSTERKD